MNDCIRVDKLTKLYKKKETVRSVSFQVKQGQCFALLGPNGAGKSTILNMVAALLERSSGSIFIDGLNLENNREKIKQRIGIVFQEDVLDQELTIYKNLYLRGGFYFATEKELQEHISWITELLSLQEILYKKYRTCSGGQKRLAQLARAMISNPKLLILDEPTTGLDPVTRLMVWQTLNQLKHKLNITIFFTTHYFEEVMNADEICILDKGGILLCSSVRRILMKCGDHQSEKRSSEKLEDLYLRLLMQK